MLKGKLGNFGDELARAMNIDKKSAFYLAAYKDAAPRLLDTAPEKIKFARQFILRYGSTSANVLFHVKASSTTIQRRARRPTKCTMRRRCCQTACARLLATCSERPRQQTRAQPLVDPLQPGAPAVPLCKLLQP